MHVLLTVLNAYLGLSHVAFSFATKDERRSVFSLDVMGDQPFLITSVVSIVTIVLVTEFGLFRRILDTTNLNLDQWLICIVVGLLIVVVSEICRLVWKAPLEDEPVKATLVAPATAPAA